MIIYTNKFIPARFNAITIYPFILMRPDPAPPANAGLIAHEMVHYREQRNSLIIGWLLCYLLSPTFRLRAEARGYAAQVVGGYMTEADAHLWLLSYDLDFSPAFIYEALVEALLEARE